MVGPRLPWGKRALTGSGAWLPPRYVCNLHQSIPRRLHLCREPERKRALRAQEFDLCRSAIADVGANRRPSVIVRMNCYSATRPGCATNARAPAHRCTGASVSADPVRTRFGLVWLPERNPVRAPQAPPENRLPFTRSGLSRADGRWSKPQATDREPHRELLVGKLFP